jgi:hypothetical protein
MNRTFYGDEFYSASPERSTDTMLPDIPILQSKIEDIGLHLRAEATESNIADKRALAASLGCQEARNGMAAISLQIRDLLTGALKLCTRRVLLISS